MKKISETNTAKIKVTTTIGDQKLVRFVGHGDSETRTNVKIIISLCLLILSNKHKKENCKFKIKKTENKNQAPEKEMKRINHQRLKYKESWNESNHIVAVFFSHPVI